METNILSQAALQNPSINQKSINEALSQTTTENLGKDEFLKLLTVQLSHQDPLKPMSNTEFISQMAEFSALEQMKNVNNSVEKLQAEFGKLANMNLVGKKVSFANYQGEYRTGVIEKISLTQNQEVVINGQKVNLDKVTSLLSETSKTNQPNEEKIKRYEDNLKTIK